MPTLMDIWIFPAPIKTPANVNANETFVSIFPIQVLMIPNVSYASSFLYALYSCC